MVSACSLVKPTLTSGVGLFPPFSHMSVMDEKKACGGGHIINKEQPFFKKTEQQGSQMKRDVCEYIPETFH